jgi:speckle-type POZ protein
MCEDVLCKNLDVSNVTTTIHLAERHNCSQLKAECLRFISYPSVFKEVALTPEFQNLINTCPSILNDIKALIFL